MSLERILGMAGGAMDAQSKRLSLAVENIANDETITALLQHQELNTIYKEILT